MRIIKFFFCSIPLILVPYQQCEIRVSADSHQLTEQATIPLDLSYATDFVRLVESTGLVVIEVLRSHNEAMLRETHKAAFVRTNKGVIEVVFFPGETDAEKITVTYSRIASSAVPHRYVINGEAINGKSETWEAASPQYITLHKNWFITTSECDLDTLIKRALRQTNRPARQ
jgi:hypothetical protein